MSATKRVIARNDLEAIRRISEKDFQQNILDLAKIFHWRRAHFRAAMTKHGWRTPVQADGKGFPDLVLVKPPRLIIAEVKRQSTSPNEFQREWLDDFAGVPGVEVYVWKPADWDEVVATISRDAYGQR